ncbi:MAG: quinone oxidoreductase [Rhodobacteraceae bacterium]|nr:quinone oxidoreductase [Paracoccaceae bacterium]
MNIAIKLSHPGSAGLLEDVAWPSLAPAEGELRIRHELVGVNFIDSYFRTGLYNLPEPFIPGVEGIGHVEAIGAGVAGYEVGQRVVYCALPGAFATTRILPAWRALPLPDTIPSDLAAASLLRGMTAHMLLTETYAVSHNTVVLIHAAAGGLGGLLTQWAKHLGATVIGTVGTSEKADVARRFGADHVIVGRSVDLVGEIDRLTNGKGVDFAIDGIGSHTLRRTLACIRPDGCVASIGQVAGPIPAISVEDFAPKRAVRFARPSIMAFAANRSSYRSAGSAVLDMIERGIAVEVGSYFPLIRAADALDDLENGRGSGAKILKI